MMRYCIAVLGGLCIVALATPVQEQGQYGGRKSYRVADKQYLQRQRDILRLYRYVNQPTYYSEHVQLAQSYSIENNLDGYTNPQVVKQLLYYYRSGMLPRGEVFSVFYEEHLQQAIALYKALYYAKDYDTFYKTAVWARYYINEGLYLYSLSVAVLHRPDTYGIVLPPIYEIYPYYFYNAEVIQQAQQYKQLYGGGQQQHQQQGDYIGYLITANYSGWYLNLHPEQSLSYYTEDVGINAYYYYYNLYRPFWLQQEDGYINTYQRGEEFYYFYQQLLARYYLERLSNNLGEIGLYDYEQPLETGYTSSLVYPNGLQFSYRPNWAQFGQNYYTYGQSYSFKGKYGYSYYLVQDYERRIRDAIDSGYVITHDGQRINLYEPQGFNLLGNIIESNPDSPNTRYYGYLQIFARYLLGYTQVPLNKYRIAPSVLQHYETSLRDPVFYQLYKRLILYFQQYKYYLPKYSYNDLVYTGVKIEDVQVDRLITYYDYFDADISNAVYYNQQEYQGDGFQIRVRQQRLNHKPFNYKINVVSEQAGQAVVRVYLGPKYDQYGRYIDISENRINFVELDRFRYDLQSGKNVIERNSRQIYSGDYAGYQQLYQRVDAALSGGSEQYNVYGSEVLYTYPNRYLLPRGQVGGQTYQLYVIISPYKSYQPQQQYQQQYQQVLQQQQQRGVEQGQGQAYYYPLVGLGIQNIDGYPLGYPFDRPIDQYNFYVPNAYFRDVTIYQKHVEDINVSTQN